jgi:hypothetical protein
MKPLVILCVLLAGCGTDAVEVGEEVATSGEVDLEWAIFETGQIVSCVDARASEVRVLAIALDRDAEQMEVLGCYAGIGAAGPVLAGEYDFQVQLVSPAGGIIDQVEIHDVSVAGGRTTPLGPVEFAIGGS